jgi:hypothetical protein
MMLVQAGMTAIRSLHREGVKAMEEGERFGYVRAVVACGLIMVVLTILDPVGFVEELRDARKDA